MFDMRSRCYVPKLDAKFDVMYLLLGSSCDLLLQLINILNQLLSAALQVKA